MTQHVTATAHPPGMLASLWRNRTLLLQLTRREVVSRYRGSIMGLAWSFFNPVLMLAVYTFVFSVVFKARWGTGGDQSRTDFAILLFVGMIVHGLFAECVNCAPSVIIANANYVKKVVFPLEVLPVVALASAMFHSFISLVVLLVAQLALNQTLPWTVVLFPLIALPLALATIGIAWILSSVGVFLRDVAQVTGIFTTVLMFLSPVFFPVSALPARFQWWLELNPLTFIIEQSRAVLVFGQLPDWSTLGLQIAFSAAVASIGFWWFQKTRKGFADVL